jgi:hypothetical protein
MIQCNLSKIGKKAVLQAFGFSAGFLLVWYTVRNIRIGLIVKDT